jgi:hypothetical protein
LPSLIKGPNCESPLRHPWALRAVKQCGCFEAQRDCRAYPLLACLHPLLSGLVVIPIPLSPNHILPRKVATQGRYIGVVLSSLFPGDLLIIWRLESSLLLHREQNLPFDQSTMGRTMWFPRKSGRLVVLFLAKAGPNFDRNALVNGNLEGVEHQRHRRRR